ncbi:MAG: PIN domain-containing protein [Desulfurococcales archaeon]|nr:PIN domain-containing protein [Desulfurococcales archaeon]
MLILSSLRRFLGKREVSGVGSLKERLRKVVLDTGLLVEYIVRKSNYREFLKELLSAAGEGEIELYVSPVTVAEVYYIASRIYSAAGLPNPDDEALRFATWVHRKFSVVEMTFDLLIKAGELKRGLRLAFPDCFVIASAELVRGSALFKKVEREMQPVMKQLKQHNVLFADEIMARE